MATLGTMSNYLENKLINHVLRNTTYTPPASVWLALYTVAPSETKTGTEVSGGSYARQNISGSLTVSGHTATNGSTIVFPQATAEWGTIVGVAIMDAATNGNILFWGTTNNQVLISTGEIFSINSGMLDIALVGSAKGGWGDGIPAQILNHVLKNTPFSSPGTSVYIACGSTLTTDAYYTFISWGECAGAGYSRKQATSWYAPVSGSTCTLSNVVFATPPLATTWGAITHIVIFDAAASGNALLWGKLHAPVYITAGDGFKFAAGDINVVVN